jgi:hygromycin-B 4-O-kinase
MPESPESIRNFLQAHFHPGAEEVTFLSAGWFSQAYAFHAGGQAYIVRLNAWLVDFQKDVFAMRFASPTLPVPRVLFLERFDDRRYAAITPRCAGRDLSQWDADTRRRLVPQMFAILDELRAWDATSLPGWGLTGGEMQGQFTSWSAYLQAIYNQKFSYRLEDLAGTFFEPGLYQTVLAAMARDFRYLPEQKWLIHGDFGDNNLVSDGECITGVLDWAEARLGDYLFDIANLDYWSRPDGIPYAHLWHEHAARQGLEEPYFAERMRCYSLYITAHGLRLSAYRDDYEDYCWAKTKAAEYV